MWWKMQKWAIFTWIFKNQSKQKIKIKQNYILKIGELYDLREFFHIFSQKEKSETKFKMKIKIKTNKIELIDFHEFSGQSKHFQKFYKNLTKSEIIFQSSMNFFIIFKNVLMWKLNHGNQLKENKIHDLLHMS